MTLKASTHYEYTCNICGSIEETQERGQRPELWAEVHFVRDQGPSLTDKKKSAHLCPACADDLEEKITVDEVSEVARDEAENSEDLFDFPPTNEDE